ncbi:MAG: monofunctional biosynthetic peptidoglycan transglycosylase [Bacteroidia bacterium]|nr:monofunctional biosynthetic peptidoglycan transglycosylase [Bacteroidota bacterium]MBP6426095.1 monofunctional biosynthetic peptidoglycan transglycosylase [Bacteroidia bacterium]
MLKKILRIIFKTAIWFFAISILSVIIFRFVPIPVTPLMLIRCVEQKWDGKEMKLKKDWVSLDKISSAMPLAVIAAEDQKFEEHFGFDLEAIRKAENYNKKHQGKRMKGASTISQQTAKNVFLWQGRNWIRKGFEVYFTFLIEIFWSKQRIMEVYLNVIEMGNGIYGVEAAAQEYFHKPASKLSVREASLIAAILPSPLKWSPVKPNARVQKKAGRIMHFISRLKLEDF